MGGGESPVRSQSLAHSPLHERAAQAQAKQAGGRAIRWTEQLSSGHVESLEESEATVPLFRIKVCFSCIIYLHFPTVWSEDILFLRNLQTKGKFVFLVLFPSELEFIMANITLSGKYKSVLCHWNCLT